MLCSGQGPQPSPVDRHQLCAKGGTSSVPRAPPPVASAPAPSLPPPQFFSDVKEAAEALRKSQEAMRRKFACDRTVTVTRLEDLLQDSLVSAGGSQALPAAVAPCRLLTDPLFLPLQEEKERLAEYQGHLAGLGKRAKTIVQLKPRSPATPLKGRLPLQAVCDYKQMEVRGRAGPACRGGVAPCRGAVSNGRCLSLPPQITVHKGDSCTLLSNAQPYKWKVLNAAGNESVMPSVCFVVPPPNKEALEAVSRSARHPPWRAGGGLVQAGPRGAGF